MTENGRASICPRGRGENVSLEEKLAANVCETAVIASRCLYRFCRRLFLRKADQQFPSIPGKNPPALCITVFLPQLLLWHSLQNVTCPLKKGGELLQGFCGQLFVTAIGECTDTDGP